MKKVLFVVTSHNKLGNTNEKTGFWVEELVAPYYELADNGIQIDIASPLGGQPPIDPKSNDESAQTTDTKGRKQGYWKKKDEKTNKIIFC